MLHVNVDLYHTTNRTATTNGPISLAGAASLGKYGYGNGIAVMERISGTVLLSKSNHGSDNSHSDSGIAINIEGPILDGFLDLTGL